MMIGLTTGHTLVVRHDKDGTNVPVQFRKEAIAKGCVPVGVGAEDVPDPLAEHLEMLCNRPIVATGDDGREKLIRSVKNEHGGREVEIGRFETASSGVLHDTQKAQKGSNVSKGWGLNTALASAAAPC